MYLVVIGSFDQYLFQNPQEHLQYIWHGLELIAFGNFCTIATKKIQCEVYKGVFGKNVQRLPYYDKKNWKSPNLDNEFLKVVRTKHDS
jgi:hypothetical protein